MKNPFSKVKTIKIPQFFEVIKPTYVILQIIPDTSIRNYDSSTIAKSMIYMRKRLLRRIRRDKFTIKYEKPMKISFMLDIQKQNVSFYFIVPKLYKQIIKEQCVSVWSKATIKEIESIENFSDKARKYQVRYAKEDGLSCKVDKKTNEPLNHILSVMEIMEENDRVGILYNFIPCPQKPWIEEYDKTLAKYKNHQMVDKQQVSNSFIAKSLFLGLVKVLDTGLYAVTNALTTSNKNKQMTLFDEKAISSLQKSLLGEEKKISSNTNKKRELNILKTQIVVMSQSKDQDRALNNGLAVCDAYKMLDENNQLVYDKLNDKAKINYTDYNLKGSLINKMSTEECKMLLELPGRDLLNQFSTIKKIDVLQNPVPKELRQGNLYLGISECKEEKFTAYIRSAYKFESLPLLLIAPQGGGKTTFISNLNKDANKAKQCNIVIDYIKNCELSETIKSIIPPEDLIEIDLSKEENYQAFAFNEVKYDDNNPSQLLEVANLKAEQTVAFVDSINVEGKPLSTKMRRYLNASSNIVYLIPNTSIGDVLSCLENHNKRRVYVESAKPLIPQDKMFLFEDHFSALEELDEKVPIKENKVIVDYEVVGTHESKIDGILDRINLLKENIRLKQMFYMSSENNIDFVKAMDEHKTILIKMPEHKFTNRMVKNVITTFFTTKVVLSMKLQGEKYLEPPRVNMYFDEIFQAPTSQYVLNEEIAQLRKFGLKVIISGHFFDQLVPCFKDSLVNVGTGFMLLHGCTEENYNELKSYLQPYTLEDLLNLKEYHSLNLIKYEKGYAKFITKLPNKIR